METNSVALRKLTLRQLQPDLTNVLVVAVIIGKQRPKMFKNLKANESGERAVWNFTIRDSPQDYLNATFWGSANEILKICDSFQIGDVVEVIRPRIIIRSIDNCGEKFRPMVTSPYTLTLNENESQVLRHENPQNYLRLLQHPTKPLAGFVTIADVQNADQNRVNKFVDMLVAVRSIGAIRSVKTKSGIEQQVRDFTVLDHTSDGIRISIWDPELMVRAGFWKPRLTVLFMADMKIDFSQFHNSLMPNISSRTIITEDPIGAEAETLRTYAATAPLQPVQIIEHLVANVQHPEAIQNVMTVQQVMDKITNFGNALPRRADERKFSALLFVVVTQLDLDGLSRVTSTRCKRCKYLVSEDGICENQDCVLTRGLQTVDLETSFDIRMNLTDHTGSLNNCRLTGTIAEKVLNCSVHEFIEMSDSQKCDLKWKYLMERCAVRIMVLCSPNSNPLTSIMSCSLASPSEVASRLPHY